MQWVSRTFNWSKDLLSNFFTTSRRLRPDLSKASEYDNCGKIILKQRFCTLAAGTVHSTRWSQIFARNPDFCLPHLHSTPPLGEFPSEYCHDVWYGKTRMMCLCLCHPMHEKNGDTIIRFDRIHERDRRTDTQTDGHRTTA